MSKDEPPMSNDSSNHPDEDVVHAGDDAGDESADTVADFSLRRRLSRRLSNPAGQRRRYQALSRSASLTVADFTSQWSEVFRMFDVNLDGLISCDELGSKMRSLGFNVTQTEVEDLVHEWDKDEKSALSLTEFTLMMNSSRLCSLSTAGDSCADEAVNTAESEEPGQPLAFHHLSYAARDTGELLELKAAFDLFDRDKNGLLDLPELKTALSLMGEDITDGDIEFILSEADTDKDGAVNFREFCDAVLDRSLSPRSPFYFHGRSAEQRRRDDEERKVRLEYQIDHVTTRTG